MNNSMGFKVIVTMISVLFLISGCANRFTPEIGAVAKEESRIPLGDSVTFEGMFHYKDIQLNYTLTETDTGYTYNGVTTFDRSLIASYPIIKRFFTKMSFLDSSGMVLETVNVTPLYRTNGLVDDMEKLKTQRSVVRPPGATHIAFNLFGTFSGLSPELAGGQWILFYFPFE